MELKTLIQADYLDIIFDQRNKDYGSYQLRKYYGNRVGKAMIILYSMLAVFIVLIVFHKPAEIDVSLNNTLTTHLSDFLVEKKNPTCYYKRPNT